MVSRFAIVLSILVLAYGVLIFHLYQLQLANGGEYVRRAEAQYANAESMKAERGTIYFTDRNNTRIPVVSNKKFPLIYAVPKALEDPLEASRRLALATGGNPDDLLKRLSNKNDTYELIQRKAESGVASRVRDLGVKGIYAVDVPERYYHFISLASHALGFVGPNSTGTGESGHYGVEEFYNKDLKGTVRTVNNTTVVPSEAGKDLYLTIDLNIQNEAQRILESLVKKHGAKGGSIVVEDPKTGKVLAMESVPTFDPNSYGEANIGTFMNPVTQKIYEPGSVAKIVTMAAGIDSGAITPETTFYDTGVLDLNGRKIKNWDLKAHGTVSMTRVIELSINTGAAFAERRIGDAVFKDYLSKFGFDRKTGVDLPGEVRGDLRNLRRDAPAVQFATASFGQGIAVTPLEMLQAAAAIANGGVLMRPYLNEERGPAALGSVISPETARTVTAMMVSAVDKADVASIKGFAIAGKTGTALVPNFGRGGYTENVIDTYIGFGPVKDPRFIVLIKLDEPEGAPHAAETVVPAFRELAQFILNYYDIPPDRLEAGR